MPRNDGFLTRAGSGNRQVGPGVMADDTTKERREKRAALEPAYELIKPMIAKLRERNRERLISVVSEDTPDDNLKATLLAIRYNQRDLDDLESTLKQILRLTPKEKKTLAEEAKNDGFE